MVEGPGCKLKGEKIKAKILRQTAKSVKGNAVDREQKGKKKEEPGVTSFQGGIVGQTLDDVLTLGKELFMFFGESCLRVHFLMAGSFRVNDQQVDTDGGKAAATASLEIQFSKDKLTFYKCAAEISPKRAVSEVMAEEDRQLCDVLLDQDILPGVGNIIKNEALFDSGLKPDTIVKELTEEHIAHLVKMTRDFSMVFYKCRKNGTNLRNYMKVYQKGKCGECGMKITMTRMGEDSERVTYFCPACQTNDIHKLRKLKLPSKNSLLGWVTTNHHTDKTDWACSKCTLLNPANQSNCGACLTSQTSQPGDNSPGRCTQSTSISVDSVTSARKRKLDGMEQIVDKEEVENLAKRARGRGSFSKEQQQTPKQGSGANISKKQTGPITTDDSLDGSKIPVCSGHGKKCVMRQTFKDNENKGRWFFTCTVGPASKKCNFFKWADEDFPICSGHGRACAFRTVMKQGPNNGRKFFCCSVKKSSCSFFEWAFGYC
ncbi:hypothetical protein BaRGS_00036021 [Batillaria attramentaria]|uniref:Endonuclease 8-like 3 n=1 Tax=Batillaria attramentaria TaxID=370345 RepID=A0ABD0JCY7_9CAEN